MSHYRIVQIVCDRCGEDSDNSYSTLADVRKYCGYVRRNGEDLCWDCAHPYMKETS